MNFATRNTFNRLAVGAGAGALSLGANAAIDTASIVTAVEAVATAGAAVGAAILIMHYGMKAYRWLRGAG